MKVIGTSIPSIKEGEDRDSFKRLMNAQISRLLRLKSLQMLNRVLHLQRKSATLSSFVPLTHLAVQAAVLLKIPNSLKQSFHKVCNLSRVGQVLLEKSIKGWKEIEFEVMRDGAGNCITVCSMENIDPVGVHTGDSIVVAPALTLADKEYQMLRKAAIDIINSIEIKGGCNVQFALDPESFNYAVIEINPRVSRSSALASKAQATLSLRLPLRLHLVTTLTKLRMPFTGKTYACFEPAIDYVVNKNSKMAV